MNLLYANADSERKGGEWACLGHGTFISVLCRYSLTGKQQPLEIQSPRYTVEIKTFLKITENSGNSWKLHPKGKQWKFKSTYISK